ncbi:MAG: anthranilate phosphoribosyltransferase [Myxococcales bacterium]
MSNSVTQALKILIGHRTLTADESREAFECIMAGNAGPAEVGAFLGVLATRIPTSEEILGAALVMREHVERVPARTDPEQLVDTCGTGGAPKTFNVSTTAAIVAAAAGAKVAKHGNRSRTGRGSAEALRVVGIQVDADRATQAACLDELGICFCYAVHHHPAIKNVMPVRLALGIPTLFNLLGPLTNPVGAKRQVMGVYDARFLKPIAGALRALGASRAIVMHSEDGLDELSISAPTDLVHVTPEGLRAERVTPEELGLSRAPRDAVVARDLDHAAELVRAVISGTERGAPRDMTLMSAAAALLVADKVQNLKEGVALAARTIDEKRAQDVLERWIQRSNA